MHNECMENRAEFIRDREEGNFCLYFTFREEEEADQSEKDDARAKLEAMFGGGKPPQTKAPQSADEAKARLEALFKKK